MQEDQRSSDDDNSRSGVLPRSDGFSKARRGWEGDHLELERERPIDGGASFAAVELEQFRNHQIGIGYQATHVIRQKSVLNSSVVIQNMTVGAAEETGLGAKKKRKGEPMQKSRLQQYLQNDGLRKFRKELSSIESSTLTS